MQVDKNTIFQMRFPQKLWYLINLRINAILWGGTGRTILLNYRVLGNYLQSDHSIFKTTNISSFVRQLNLYGFRKVTSHLQDPLCNSSNPYMHEYVHDYFQYGRSELLNRVIRKTLTLRKKIKPRGLLGSVDQMIYLTPLQKARCALRLALRKAAQDLVIQNSPQQFSSSMFKYKDLPDSFCEDEDTVVFDWITTNKNIIENYFPKTENTQDYTNDKPENTSYCGEISQDSLMNFNVDSCHHQNTFTGQFLNMPVLDPEPPADNNSSEELLAGFNIDNDSIARKINENRVNIDNSLNCVLPSVSNDQNDDVAISEKNNDQLDHYHGEWDQMFNDMASKAPSQECASDLKELYSQISITIDLLNN